MDYFVQLINTFLNNSLSVTTGALCAFAWVLILQITLIWRNHQLRRALKRLDRHSFIDPLTELHNYKYFCRRLKESLHQARKNNFCLSLTKIDIELFKNVNKIYGPVRGDEILKAFAQFLSKNSRSSDILARIEDDEFILISNYSDKNTALTRANDLQESLSLNLFGSEKVNLQISIGVVAYPDDATSQETLLSLLDQCLDYSKQNKNKISTLKELKTKTEGADPDLNNEDKIHDLKEKIVQLTSSLNRTTLETIIAFANTIKAKDLYTAEHTERTVTIAVVIANELNLDNSQVEVIKYAAMLHDLGKVGISETILQKPGRLNEKEFRQIKKHPVIGAEILRPLHPLSSIISAILYHHERVDGKGYPYGLKNQEIPIEAKIVALADSFQALTSDRPYRKAFSVQKAIDIIKGEAGNHFDPAIVDAFLNTFQN